MLNTQSTPALSAPGALAWQSLDIPHRVALVIDRGRLVGGFEQVRDVDFQAAPETCDLSIETIRANIGKATKILVEEGVPQIATYDRAARLKVAGGLVLGLMPAIPTIHTTLRQQGFGNAEIAELWNDLITGAARGFRSDRAPVPDIGAHAREFLSKNAD